MIRRRDVRAQRVQRVLGRDAATRHILVRANPLTCTSHEPGRASIALSCRNCNGTGYLDGLRSDLESLATRGSPYNALYFIQGDIQMGHGLRGSGGQSSFSDGDRGTEVMGDAIFFFPSSQRDSVYGMDIYPIVGSLPRPDRIIRTEDGQVFTVLHVLEESYGSSPLYKAVTLGINVQGSPVQSIQN